MNHFVYVVSFDLIRSGEPPISYAVGSLIASLSDRQAFPYQLRNMSFQLLQPSGNRQAVQSEIDAFIEKVVSESVHAIAIGAYVWAEREVQYLIKRLREAGFHDRIILGGYQISYDDASLLDSHYPSVDVFISGYAEDSLFQAIMAPASALQKIYSDTPNFQHLPSPYSSGVIPVVAGQKMIRTETRRGCPYRCTFCAHRDLTQNKVYQIAIERKVSEFELFQARSVGKINILDPIFDSGPASQELIKELIAMRFKPQIALQARFEMLRQKAGVKLLDKLSCLNVKLEFGLQTAVEAESVLINRRNDLQAAEDALKLVQERDIPLEVSLIYGLPGQTYDSFAQSIDWLQSRGVKDIKAWPLMLLRGTELQHQKQSLSLQEERIDDEGFGIPVVTQSYSYSRSDWERMHRLASELATGFDERIQ